MLPFFDSWTSTGSQASSTRASFPWQVLFARVDGKKWQVFPWQVALFKSWHASFWTSFCQGKTWQVENWPVWTTTRKIWQGTGCVSLVPRPLVSALGTCRACLNLVYLFYDIELENFLNKTVFISWHVSYLTRMKKKILCTYWAKLTPLSRQVFCSLRWFVYVNFLEPMASQFLDFVYRLKVALSDWLDDIITYLFTR